MPAKSIIITGATSMIGEACANLLVEKGMQIMLVGRSQDKLEALANSVGGKVEVAALDMCGEASIQSMVAQTVKTFGSVDGVVHNVSIYPWAEIEKLSVKDWQSSLDVGLTAAFLMTKACIPYMKKQSFGRLIYMSSLAGENMGLPNMSAYAAAKAGLNGFMRTAAIELARYGITANSITPGKMYERSQLTDTEIETKLKPVPLKQFTPSSDIAAMALHLLSDAGSHITGQNFIIDGGQSVLGEDGHLGL